MAVVIGPDNPTLLSTSAPTDLLTLFEEETREIQRLLAGSPRMTSFFGIGA
jgi:hypothetical protein